MISQGYRSLVESTRQLGVNADEALLGVGGGVTGGSAEGRSGREGALDILAPAKSLL